MTINAIQVSIKKFELREVIYLIRTVGIQPKADITSSKGI